MAPSTEIVLVNATRCCVEGKAEDVERQILDAARGSLLELVWFTETESGQRIALNPEHVVLLRARASYSYQPGNDVKPGPSEPSGSID